MFSVGDANFRFVTKRPKRRRGGKRKRDEDSLTRCRDNVERVSMAKFLDEKTPRQSRNSAEAVRPRLVGDDLDLLKEHIRSYQRTHEGACQSCGQTCFTKCGICNVRTCFKDGPNMWMVSCCLDYHNDNRFGLGMKDRFDIFSERKKNFRAPSTAQVRKNAAHIQELKKSINAGLGRNL